MISLDKIRNFYLKQLHQGSLKGEQLLAPCPFCRTNQQKTQGTLAVILNPDSYFYGYFRCTNQCIPGGFHFHLARLLRLDLAQVPGFDPDDEEHVIAAQFPARSLRADIDQFTSLMSAEQKDYFGEMGVSDMTLKSLRVGFNGRYLVFPYFQDNGLAYAARCVMPHHQEDYFWHGNEAFSQGEFAVYNAPDIMRCRGGALFITVGELDLLILKELGYPAAAVPSVKELPNLVPARLAKLEHIFLLMPNAPEARQAAKDLAVHLGFKARILNWPPDLERDQQLYHLAMDPRKEARKSVAVMIKSSTVFSPFASPQKEHRRLADFLEKEKGKDLMGLQTGFSKLDQALEGLRGINILGGPPKAGKSCFFMQISTEVAERGVPVIYYDFENGRQKIYLRTLVRLSGLTEKSIRQGDLGPDDKLKFQKAWEKLKNLLGYFRVVTDRKLTPDTMRRHIDFIKHETRRDELLIVVDSLHKLPFKDLSERRTGIDWWLRNLESIRDEQSACFLVISELSRGKEGGYGERPDLSSFKESGDIEYSADNAMILMPDWDPLEPVTSQNRKSLLWVVASRENNPGRVSEYLMDFPYWRFKEI